MNAAENLLLENDPELDKIFGKGNWEFGSRFPFEAPGDKGKRIRHNLMPDAEYFVPLAVKICGNYFGSSVPEMIQARTLYENAGMKDYSLFWKESGGPSGMAKMITAPDKGYYEILEATGDRHVLVGYSQGGLAALYLAWLDRKVFKNNIIHGIITVSSPNFGSPLANDRNKPIATDSFLRILMNFFSLDETFFTKLFEYFKSGFQLDGVIRVFDGLLDGAERMPATEKTKESFRAFIDSLKKWAGGIMDDENNAFADLDIRQILTPGSVLNTAVCNLPDDILRGAVMSGDGNFHAIVHSFLKDNLSFFIRPFVNLFIDNLKILDKPMPANMDRISAIFRDELMTENLTDAELTNPVIRKMRDGFLNGDPEWKIPAASHDFVIPSIYETLPGPVNSTHLGCYLNPKASHNSGKSLHFAGGWENRRLILKMMSKMR